MMSLKSKDIWKDRCLRDFGSTEALNEAVALVIHIRIIFMLEWSGDTSRYAGTID